MRNVVLIGVTILCIAVSCDKSPSDVQEENSKSMIFIASIPPVADVYADGNLVGKTNVAEINLTPGKHEMSFRKDSLSYDTVLTLLPGKNPSIMVRLN
jgi:hypothetical protein